MNENKKINNLKRLIVLISIAILIFAVVLVMSIYNNKFGVLKDDGIHGGRKTVSTTTVSGIITEEVPDTTTTTEPTTTTEITTEVPTTTVRTTKAKNNNNGGSSSNNRRVIPPTSGKVVIEPTQPSYTVITSGGSGFAGADVDYEWGILNKINAKRSNKLKMASELRNMAETGASNAAYQFFYNEKCSSGLSDIFSVSYCSYPIKTVDEIVNKMIDSTDGLLTDGEYVGIGVVKYNTSYYSYVIVID